MKRRHAFNAVMPQPLTACVVMAAILLSTSYLLVPSASRGATIIPLAGCATITSAGEYQLTSNITTPTGQTCLVIRASNVTINGNGKTITAPDAYAVDVQDLSDSSNNWNNISVHDLISNGDVRIFGNGINHVTFERLNVTGITNYGGDDVVVRDNTIGTNGFLVSNADRAGWIPYRNTFTNNTVYGGNKIKTLVEVVGGSTHPCPRLDTVISNNTITDTRNDVPQELNSAVRVRCATHTVFSGNMVRSTGTSLGLYLRDESDDGVYENNKFIVNNKPALWLGSGNVDKTHPARNIFRNNIFRTDTGYSFYALGAGPQNIFTDNVFYANDSGLLGYFNCNEGSVFDHNTFFNAATSGPTLTLTGNNSDGPPADRFTNNIFSYAGSQVFGYDAWRAARYNGGDYNIFYNRGGSLSFGFMGSFSAWRTGTGDDAHSINADPLLVNPVGGDYTLRAGSPAMGAASDGTNIGARGLTSAPPIVTPTCTEIWKCGSWSECKNSTQARTCVDVSACNSTALQPALTQACTVANSNPNAPSNPGPQTVITSPSGKKIVSGQIAVKATAKDGNGIARVNFFIDGKQFGSDTRLAYSAILETRTLINGQHVITVQSYDKLGAMTSIDRIVTVRNVLYIRWSNPATKGIIRGSTTLQPRLIYGGTGTARIEYYIDRKLFKTAQEKPYGVTWDSRSVRNGVHRFSIRVIDNNGRQATHVLHLRVLN